MSRISLSALGALAVIVATTAGFAQEPKKASDPKRDPAAVCMEMMQSPGVTEEGKKAMREFMQSDRAPQAMANMMEMARRMGNGDLMHGMTRMMEMMGGQSEMMGPGARQPGK